MAMDSVEATAMAETAETAAEAVETAEATDMAEGAETAEAVEVAEIEETEGETIPSRRREKAVGASRDGIGGRAGRAGISLEEMAAKFLSTRIQWASP